MRDIVKEFIDGTDAWANSFPKDFKQCCMCGIRPEEMKELVIAIKELREKAWKYDELSK